MKQFLKKSPEFLKGEWVLLGGALLPLLGENVRSTTDIDLVPLKEQRGQLLNVFNLAEALKLPIESVNLAASYFLLKMKDYEHNLILIHETQSFALYRPNLFLYLQLKLKRLSQTDLEDCLSYIRYTKKKKEPFKESEIMKLLQTHKDSLVEIEKKRRVEKILSSF